MVPVPAPFAAGAYADTLGISVQTEQIDADREAVDNLEEDVQAREHRIETIEGKVAGYKRQIDEMPAPPQVGPSLLSLVVTTHSHLCCCHQHRIAGCA